MFHVNGGLIELIFFFAVLFIVTVAGTSIVRKVQSDMGDGKPPRELVETVISRHNVYEEGDEVMLCGEKLESVGSVVPVKSLFYIRLKDGTTYLTGNANVVVRSRHTQAED